MEWQLKSDQAKQKILEVKQSIMKGLEAQKEESKQKKRSDRESELAAKVAYHKAEKKGEEIGRVQCIFKGFLSFCRQAFIRGSYPFVKASLSGQK